MFSTTDKSHTNHVNRKAQNSGTTFFRKAGEESFFGSKESSSFFNPTIQAKLSVSAPDDPQEKEADAVAEQVMRMPEATAAPSLPNKEEDKLQRKEEDGEIQPKIQAPVISIQRKCTDCENDVQAKLFRLIQRSEEGSCTACGLTTMDGDANYSINPKHISLFPSDVIQCSGRGPPPNSIPFEQSLSSTKGAGSALPENTRHFMESRFQADFRGVRIHTGTYAESMSRQINAQAFTHGNDIYFNSNKYSPQSGAGSTLLAHELTHTIQQGASKTVSNNSSGNSIVSRKPIIQRSFGAPVSQLDNAISKAKSQEGKINAGKEGPDGFRTGWEQLLDIFKTTFGEDKIISGSGGTATPGTVSETDIKKYREAKGNVVIDGDPKRVDPNGMRDAMPSWCGIFVFWALNKAGVPMPKWKLGQSILKPESLNPPGTTPKPGDIAYRTAYSHFAIVESVNGDSVRTVNGNTAGEDNMGGQVQSREHPLSNWTGFFNPLVAMEGSLGNGDSQGPVNEKPKTMQELRRELLNLNRKEEPETSDVSEETIQQKIDLSNWSVNANGTLQTGNLTSGNINGNAIQAKEEEKKEEEKGIVSNQPTLQKKHDSTLHRKDAAKSSEHAVQAKFAVQRSSEQSKSSLNTYSNAETADYSNELDRGPPQISRSAETVQRSVIDDALEYIGSVTDCIVLDLNEAKTCALRKAGQVAMHIPGYRALRVVLNGDPITGEYVERNGRNFIEAAFDIMPGGNLLHQKLDEQHQLDAAAAWIDEQITRVENLVNGLSSEFDTFWNRLGITDLSSPMDVLRDGANIVLGFINRVIDFAVDAAKELLEMIKTFLLNKIVDFIKEHTTAYPLLTVILGKDPITEQEVERNGTNILNALLELGGEEGQKQRTQMMETGTFDKVVAYIDEGISVFSGAYDEIVQAFHNIWNIVSIESLMDPVGTFTEIYNQFAGPVSRVLDFVLRVAAEILKLIKEVLMQRLSAWARTVRGYALVTVIIGKDPFTDELVPFTMENVIKGFFSLMEGGEEQYNQLKESGAIDRTVAKITAAVARLNMTPAAIVQLFIDLWNSFTINDLVNPIAAFQRIIDRFGEPIGRLIAFVIEIVKIVIEAILIVMNFPFDLINNIIAKAMLAFQMIKRDPVGFLKNLLRAIKQGFIQFFDNILQHLLSGLVGWLTSELRDAGVPAFTDTSLRGIISWVLEVLGISMEKIWEKLAAHPRIGPAKVARIRSMINTLEGIWTFIKDVQERGVAAIWDKIQEQLSNLWDTILDAVKNWIMEQIVTKMVTKLLSMLDPTGIMAVVNSAIAIYSAIQSFIKYLREMLEIVNSFVEGVVDIASGNITTAANYLERTMARAVPIVIGFLANQVGLSGIGRRIGEMIGRAREMVDQALTWLVNKAVDTGMALLDRVMALGRSAVQAVLGWLGLRKDFTTRDGRAHNLYFQEGRENGVLMVASIPKTVEQLVTERRTQIQAENTATPAKVSENQPKLDALDRITQIRGQITPLITQYNSAVDRSSSAQSTQLQGQIDTKMTEIIAQLIIAGIDTEGVNNISTSVQNTLDSGRPVSVIAEPLTTIPGNTAGSTPQQEPLGWNVLTPSIRARSWVAAHLLNHHLHGPGLQWNLVSGTKETNNNMKTEIENTAKTEVMNNPNKQYFYHVTVSYLSEQPGKPYLKNFPFQISVQFGELTGQPGSFVRGTPRGRSFTQDSPDVTNTTMPSFNESSASRLKTASDDAGKNIPGTVFERIVEARRTIPSQSFGESVADLINYMDNYYVTRGYGAAGVFRTRFGGDLQALGNSFIFMNY